MEIEYKGWIIKNKIKGFRVWYEAVPKKHPYSQFVLHSYYSLEHLKTMIDIQIKNKKAD